ncbi:MAG: fused MFS/spermidine synthase [Deltaproteobacteria bacterium]
MKRQLKLFILWAIIGTGVSSIAVQLVTVREFLSHFHGNEVTISLVLFSWLLLSGVGSFAAKAIRRPSVAGFAVVSGILALWPLPQLILIRTMRESVFVHGSSPGFNQTALYILLTIAPYCLLLGFILPYSLRILNEQEESFTSGGLYVTDSIGDIAGGVLFSFVLVYSFTPFVTVAITSGLLILAVLGLFLAFRRYVLFFFALAFTGLFCLFSLNNHFEKVTLSRQYGEILRYVESPYGRIVITKEGPQHTFWESGTPFYSNADTVNSEEKIHYALSQLDEVGSVLLVSGGLGETLAEVSKYGPSSVDYVELDPNLTRVAQELDLIVQSPSLAVIHDDGRRYIKGASKKYDAVIVDLPEPDTFQLNRFFTSEFFALAKGVLRKGGILSFSVETSPNYLSDIQRSKLSILYNTAKQHFRNVVILPGEKAYFLCRDGDLWMDVPARLALKSVTTSYVEGFFHGNVTQERIEGIRNKLDPKAPANTDFEPRIMTALFQEWLTKHGSSPKVFGLVALSLTLLYLFFLRRVEYVLFTTGIASMGVEMLVIFTFQVMYGYIYLKLGAIVTAFLTGLLPGALFGNLFKGRGWLPFIVSEIILFSLLILFYVGISFSEGDIPQVYFLGYCFVFSFFCGYQFPLAADLIGEKESPVAGCLAADLTGAAVGTLVTGAILIPLLGIQVAIIFLILVKISSNLFVLFPRGRTAP